MSAARQPILVLGATGRQGGAVAGALLRAHWPVRALVRDPSGTPAGELRRAGAELVVGTFEDIDAIRRAMRGVHGVFSVLPSNLEQDDEVRYGRMVADLAAEAGVQHFVYSSGASVGEKLTGVPRFDAKPLIEAHVRALPIMTTIVRPMIFMEMLLRPGYGLEQARYTFFLAPDQPMQLIAVADIGRFVAAIFADQAGYAGRTIKIAGDTVTGREIGEILTEAAGRPIAYARFPEDVLANNPDLAHMSASLESGPLADHVDLSAMREVNASIRSFRDWIHGSGRQALESLLGGNQQKGKAVR